MTSPCADYMFRNNAVGIDENIIIRWLKNNTKNWEFQEELSDDGYLHYQGRFSLIKKRRKAEIASKLFPFENWNGFNWWKPTHDLENNYSLKADTRTRGPWSSNDKEIYIPRQYRNRLDKLYPFQKTIWDSQNTFDDRSINLIYCPEGNKGKSTIASLMELHNCGIDLPSVNDYKELVQAVCDICESQELHNPKTLHIDLPRALDKTRLFGMISAIEQIKKGKLFDFRYKYKVWWIDSPQIWVYSNWLIDTNMLSKDRWKIWTINDNLELIKYENKPLQSSIEDGAPTANGNNQLKI